MSIHTHSCKLRPRPEKYAKTLAFIQAPSSPASSPTLAIGSTEHPKAYRSAWLSRRTAWMSGAEGFHTSWRMEMAWFAVHCVHASAPAPLCQLEEQPEAEPEQQLPEQAVPATGPPALGKRQGLFPSLCMMPSTTASFDYCSCCCFLIKKFSGLCETSLPRLLCKLFKSKAYI